MFKTNYRHLTNPIQPKKELIEANVYFMLYGVLNSINCLTINTIMGWEIKLTSDWLAKAAIKWPTHHNKNPTIEIHVEFQYLIHLYKTYHLITS